MNRLAETQRAAKSDEIQLFDRSSGSYERIGFRILITHGCMWNVISVLLIINGANRYWSNGCCSMWPFTDAVHALSSHRWKCIWNAKWHGFFHLCVQVWKIRHSHCVHDGYELKLLKSSPQNDFDVIFDTRFRPFSLKNIF